MNEGIGQLIDVALIGEVSAQEVVEHWVEEIVCEGVNKHGY